jgi:hypothetical protein
MAKFPKFPASFRKLGLKKKSPARDPAFLGRFTPSLSFPSILNFLTGEVREEICGHLSYCVT